MSKSNLIDLHCHILPGIDDGSKSLQDSLTLARAAVADGVRYIVATPHHLDRHFTNHAGDVSLAVKAFQAELDRNGILLTVFAGQEVHLNGDLNDRLDDLLGLDATRKYLLVELPHGDVPEYTSQLFFKMRTRGVTPIIAHPERNSRIQQDPNLLVDLISEGALGQVTATSITGGFGRKVAKFARELVENDLVHIVASDAHALAGREFVLSEAYDELAKWDDELAERFYGNSKAIINGEEL